MPIKSKLPWGSPKPKLNLLVNAYEAWASATHVKSDSLKFWYFFFFQKRSQLLMQWNISYGQKNNHKMPDSDNIIYWWQTLSNGDKLNLCWLHYFKNTILHKGWKC